MTITETETEVTIVLLWSFPTGILYVGLFANGEAAAEWRERWEEWAQSPCWVQTVIDLDKRLPICAPEPVPSDFNPNLIDPGRSWESWKPRQSDKPHANWFVLMTDGDPLRLVGPFAEHREAFIWGLYDEQIHDREYGWQTIWLNYPGAPIQLMSPKEAERMYRGNR
jgi:hypothetical protein